LLDLPSIFSGKGIGFIDPHQHYFTRPVQGKKYREPTSSYLFNLEKDFDEIATLKDQFEPFMQELFGVSPTTFKDGYFKGTMFRFPFRTEGMESELSNTKYGPEKVTSLIASLMSDSHNNLLFLRHLESIEVYERNSAQEVPKKLLDVRISESYLSSVRNKRKEFTMNMIKHREWTKFPAISTTYPIGFDINTQTASGPSNIRLRWIVTQYYAGKEEAAGAGMKADLKYLPQVGVALPLHFDTEEPLCLVEPRGHIFCFLPLPVEEKSSTGLRVHVHGSFAIDQNRRHLKWPAADQDRSRLTDSDLIWNQFLVRYLLPKATLKMIDYLLRIRSEMMLNMPSDLVSKLNSRSLDFDAYLIYAVMPEPKLVREQWKSLVEIVIKEIPQFKVFYTPANGGKWLKYTDVVFDQVDKNSPLDVLKRNLMQAAQQNLSCVPEFVFKLLPKDRKEISQKQVLDSFKHVQHTQILTDDQRISLLKYLLDDATVNLVGAKLLPLDDKVTWTEFKAFNASSTEMVYVGSKNHPQRLLPGLEKMFLNVGIVPKKCKDLALTSKKFFLLSM